VLLDSNLIHPVDAQLCHKVSLHTIPIGMMGTIYKRHTELPLSRLGLDRIRVRKLSLDLNTRSFQYATKTINRSRRLKDIKERTYGPYDMALLRSLPTPTYDLLPSLMVEVCLVLAPEEEKKEKKN